MGGVKLRTDAHTDSLEPIVDDNKVGMYAVEETIREISRSVSPYYINTVTSLPLPPPACIYIYAHNRPRTKRFVTEKAGRRLDIPCNA